MRTVLEPEDIQAIADAVAARLKINTPQTIPEFAEDIMDVDGLAEYLKVEKSWVYRQVQLRAIPHFRAGRYPRFYRKQIDQWTREQFNPAATEPVQKERLRKVG